jgi:hypothetical protein
MYGKVPHVAYQSPWDIRMFASDFLRNASGGLPDNDEITNDRIHRLWVRLELPKTHAFYIRLDLLYGFNEILDSVFP